MVNKLYKTNCNTGQSEEFYPMTTLDKVVDLSTNKSLDQILQEYNHIWLPFKGNSKALTRQQIPSNLRRRGLWITYKSCAGKTVTEWYNSDVITNTAWGSNENWVQIVDTDVIKKVTQELVEWYKYKDNGKVSGNVKNLLHWYDSTMSFMWHKNNNLIPFDSIAIIGQTGQAYVQGELIGVNTEDFKKLEKSVKTIEQIFSTGENEDIFEELNKVITILKGYTKEDDLKKIIDDKVDKVKGKGLSTNDFTNELKKKLEDLSSIESITDEEIDEITNK